MIDGGHFEQTSSAGKVPLTVISVLVEILGSHDNECASLRCLVHI